MDKYFRNSQEDWKEIRLAEMVFIMPSTRATKYFGRSSRNIWTVIRFYCRPLGPEVELFCNCLKGFPRGGAGVRNAELLRRFGPEFKSAIEWYRAWPLAG